MISGFSINKRYGLMSRLGVAIIMLAMSSHRGLAQGGANSQGWDAQQPTKVVINGRALTVGQVVAFHSLYGVVPQPGEYWYDARSGLWGMVGGPAAGFIHAGHNLGPMDPNASCGTTGVFFNGRQLTVQEVMYLSAICGVQWPQGAFGLDPQGYVTFADNPMPLCNLWVQHATAMARVQAQMAQQQGYAAGGYQGQGGSPADQWVSDNYWSSGLFSGGNSNADNTQGYVNVPGYGAVSYGMP